MPAICRLYQRTGISFISYYLLHVVVSCCVLSRLVLFLWWNLRKASRSRNCCTFQSCFGPMWSLTPGSQGCYDEFVVKYVMHSGFEFCGRDWSAYNVADQFLDFSCEIRTNFWVHKTAVLWNRMRPSMVDFSTFHAHNANFWVRKTWIPTTAFWNRVRPSMVARQFCGCLTTFSLFVRLSLS